jgi:putative transcriptional regulator
MTKKTLQNKLKVYRAMEDWTQEELAQRVNVTRKTINTIENGKYVPSTYLALKIAPPSWIGCRTTERLALLCASREIFLSR